MTFKSFAAATVAAAWLMVPAAHAATFELTDEGVSTNNGGNYCGPRTGNGDFVNGTAEGGACAVNGSPWIVKYELDEDTGFWSLDVFNSLFGDADDFGGITFTNNGNGTFSFLYNADDNDPGITAFAAKGGTKHNLYEIVGDGSFFGGESVTFKFPQGSSNVTFFDTTGPRTEVVPLPASALLLLGGLGGFGALRKMRRRA